MGTDFSEVAARALEEGRRLARRLGLRVELLHVREGIGGDDGWVPGPAELGWLERVGLDPEAVAVRSGTPWLEIVRYARERPAGTVVVGTHGSTGFQPISLGGTASRLAIRSPRPVLLVGPGNRRGARP